MIKEELKTNTKQGGESAAAREKRLRANRGAYTVEAALEYFISILITGAFLAAILKNIGVSDSVTGTVTALSSFGFSAQVIAALFIRPKSSVKRMVTALMLINQLMFVFLYAIPYIKVDSGIKAALFTVMFLGGHFITNMAAPFKTNWLMSYVAKDMRGRFTANKEIISLLGGMVFSYAMGSVIDHFNAVNDSQTGFLICGATMLVLCILHFVSLVVVKDDAQECEEVQTQKYTLKQVFAKTVFDRRFSKIIALDILWQINTGLAVSYYGTYQINELGFSLTFVSALAAVYAVSRMAFSRFFGRYADKHSWANMLILSFMIGAVSFLINTFCVPENGKIVYTVYYALYAVYMAGSNSGIMNITFDYAEKEDRTYALGVKSAIGGVFGFLASLVGGSIVSSVQSCGNVVMGHTIYAQQILSFIAFAVLMFAAIYTKLVICPLKKAEE